MDMKTSIMGQGRAEGGEEKPTGVTVKLRGRGKGGGGGGGGRGGGAGSEKVGLEDQG